MASIPSSYAIASATWGLSRDDSSLRRMDGSDVIVAGRDVRWGGTLVVTPLGPADAVEWAAFLAEISALSETFDVTPPGAESGPSTGYSGANPLVAGASQLGTSLDVDGATAGAAVLARGDFFSVGGELKVATAAATADGTGAITISFLPALRAAPADNATVEVLAPVATVRLVNPLGQYAIRPPAIRDGIALEVTEAF